MCSIGPTWMMPAQLIEHIQPPVVIHDLPHRRFHLLKPCDIAPDGEDVGAVASSDLRARASSCSSRETSVSEAPSAARIRAISSPRPAGAASDDDRLVAEAVAWPRPPGAADRNPRPRRRKSPIRWFLVIAISGSKGSAFTAGGGR